MNNAEIRTALAQHYPALTPSQLDNSCRLLGSATQGSIAASLNNSTPMLRVLARYAETIGLTAVADSLLADVIRIESRERGML